MRISEIEVFPRNGSWLVQIDGRVMSGAPEYVRAERIARITAETLCDGGWDVRLRLLADEDAAPVEQTLAARLRTAA
ncbi:MAG TPA: hypothetical protein VF699_08710 [Caulobacteraceae bacterium]|jgi:hypothetical protein